VTASEDRPAVKNGCRERNLCGDFPMNGELESRKDLYPRPLAAEKNSSIFKDPLNFQPSSADI